METSQSIKELASALSKAQGKFRNVLKGSKAKIKTKSGSEYEYSYADLADVLETVMPIVSEFGLSISQCSSSDIKIVPDPKDLTRKEGNTTITTVLMHSSGEYIKNVCNLPYVDNGNNAIQAIGSIITYGRRYEVCSILGIASQKDADGMVPDKPSPKKKLSELTKSKSMREYVDEAAIARIGDSADKFKLWRIDNNLPENLDKLTELELSQIWRKILEVKV